MHTSLRARIRNLLLQFSAGQLVLGKLTTMRARRRLKTDLSIYPSRKGVWIHELGGYYLANWRPNMRCDPQRVETELVEHWKTVYLPSAGETVIYIGAGIGGESLMFARMVGSTGRVVAVEAHPKTYACLCESVKLNRLLNVETINLAVAETTKEVMIGDCDHHIGNAITGSQMSGQTIAIKADSIDRICEAHDVKTIDLLAMNIEGAEKFAVKGMTEALGRTKRLAIACHDFKAERIGDDTFRTKKDILLFLETIGFVVVGLEFEKPWHRDWVYAFNPQLTVSFA